MRHSECNHVWSGWWPCVSSKLEYKVCDTCHMKVVEPVANPPRWITDVMKK